jgi:hypothetical protein
LKCFCQLCSHFEVITKATEDERSNSYYLTNPP